jgi:hypothetical protein
MTTEEPKSGNYWLLRTSAERIAVMEQMRLEFYGKEAMRRGVERVLTIRRLDDPEP